jgi:DNA-directed RNA polymerase specialized sigma24 family protein
VALLSQPWALHNIDDLEAYCSTIIRKSQLGLQPHDDYEDLLAHCLSVAYEISLRYDASRGKFSTFAYLPVYRAAVNWVRKRKGRTIWRFSGGRVHERKPPQLLSLDDDTHGGLVESESARHGDHAAGRDESLAWLFDGRDSCAARDYELLGLEPPARVARGA